MHRHKHKLVILELLESAGIGTQRFSSSRSSSESRGNFAKAMVHKSASSPISTARHTINTLCATCWMLQDDSVPVWGDARDPSSTRPCPPLRLTLEPLARPSPAFFRTALNCIDITQLLFLYIILLSAIGERREALSVARRRPFPSRAPFHASFPPFIDVQSKLK